jgi:hypothetical protein
MINPQRAIEFFEIFKFLTKLHIHSLEISQDQLLSILKPLNKLEELNLNLVTINSSTNDTNYIGSISLPPALNKLSVTRVNLIGRNEVLFSSIRSHANLKILLINHTNNKILDIFHRCCPSLKKFEFSNHCLDIPQSLYTMLESNPQITSLKLRVGCFNRDLMNNLSLHSKNLEEISLVTPSIILDSSEKKVNIQSTYCN